MFRWSAIYVDKILKGATYPQPPLFLSSVFLKAVRTLG